MHQYLLQLRITIRLLISPRATRPTCLQLQLRQQQGFRRIRPRSRNSWKTFEDTPVSLLDPKQIIHQRTLTPLVLPICHRTRLGQLIKHLTTIQVLTPLPRISTLHTRPMQVPTLPSLLPRTTISTPTILMFPGVQQLNNSL